MSYLFKIIFKGKLLEGFDDDLLKVLKKNLSEENKNAVQEIESKTSLHIEALKNELQEKIK